MSGVVPPSYFISVCIDTILRLEIEHILTTLLIETCFDICVLYCHWVCRNTKYVVIQWHQRNSRDKATDRTNLEVRKLEISRTGCAVCCDKQSEGERAAVLVELGECGRN
jgi:hypothetical protein